MRSVRCDRCGFVQAERATCRKCGYALATAGADREPALGWSDADTPAVAAETTGEEPVLGFDEAEEPRFAVGGGRGAVRGRGEPVVAVLASRETSAPAVAEERADIAEPAAVAESTSSAATPEATKETRPDSRAKRPAAEPIARIRSVPLTATLDATGHVMVEFQCRKCDRYGVLLVPPELMETGIEGECGSCRRSTPMTRVELETKRFDRYDG